jgi:hypothetical protein
VKHDDKENKQKNKNKVGTEDDDAYPSRRPCCSAVKIGASTFNQTLNPKSILLLHTAEWDDGETKAGILLVELQRTQNDIHVCKIKRSKETLLFVSV